MKTRQHIRHIAQLFLASVLITGGAPLNAMDASSFDEKAYTQEVASRIALALP